MTARTDVVVIGGGQAGLAAGYYLRRTGLDFVILDAQDAPGGAWRHMWDSLRLFSPAEHSSLPGRPMPPQPGRTYPDASHVIGYLKEYEERYGLPVHRPVRVLGVHRDGDDLRVETDSGRRWARSVISATGTWWRPLIPAVRGREIYRGRQLHTVGYRDPGEFTGRSVTVVGAGNSAAQIAADLAGHAELTWVTRHPPRFLADDVDGRALFAAATARRRALDAGEPDPGGVAALGDIVATPPVRAARNKGLLRPVAMFDRLEADGPVWADGTRVRADAVIWCTGFRPALGHLAPLGLRRSGGLIPTDGTRSVEEPRLHLLGYGDWTGPASATLIGVGLPARDAVRRIAALVRTGGR
ncbi:ArsO family NAD(P)H-dependent flavin-containing monooxygenase [Streptomyces sodiiphilus]|uniref:ArsO family NAD(P)H-dependent flavin-containing monooxygenase n=1 Tax=Streptomyces sodiiphilus TaxID=226217 RepID=UPI0031DEDB96